jgi:hypothetical protein
LCKKARCAKSTHIEKALGSPKVISSICEKCKRGVKEFVRGNNIFGSKILAITWNLRSLGQIF